MKTERIDEGLFRLLVPFEDGINTTVYVAFCDGDVVLIDSATHASDADDYILPALSELGVMSEQVTFLLLTHPHRDHAGGTVRLLECLPNVQVRASFFVEHERFSYLKDGEILAGRLQAVLLPGHTQNSFGFLDLKTKTLLSGDCLQLKGVGKYRKGISLPLIYRQSIDKLKQMDICRIVASHEYDPLGSVAEGKERVMSYLETCLEFG